MRKNIFELLLKELNLTEEIKKIEYFLSNNVPNDDFRIEEYVDERCFCKWKHRKKAFNTVELRNKLGISSSTIIQSKQIPLETLFIYMEYVVNLFYLFDRYIDHKALSNCINFYGKDSYIFENIEEILHDLNHKLINLDKDDIKWIIVENNPAATAVAEMIVDNDIGIDIIRYN